MVTVSQMQCMRYLGNTFCAGHFRLHLGEVVIVRGDIRHDGFVIGSRNVDICKEHSRHI